MKHIGMDVHSTTTDACVRNGRGVIVLRKRIPTTKSELVKLVQNISGHKRVVLEEDQMADWVTRALEPHVDEVIRSQPRYNKLISVYPRSDKYVIMFMNHSTKQRSRG